MLDRSSVSPAFAQFAASYDSATPIQSVVANFLADHIKMHWQAPLPPRVVIDVGCGTGKLTHACCLRLPPTQIYGIDNAAPMLALWQQRLDGFEPLFGGNGGKNNRPQGQPILSKMQHIALPSQSADMVMSSFALHWATPSVMAELGRLVKHGGQLHVAVPVAGSFHEVIRRFPKIPIYQFLPSSCWLDAVAQLLRQRQGHVLYQIEQRFSHSYTDLQTLLKNLKKMGGAVSGQEQIPMTVLRQYLQDSTPVSLDYQMLILGLSL
jgi:ubiquinone/menaquinone biosynthesis C-methylase UbiE